jgi:hypothetical protein
MNAPEQTDLPYRVSYESYGRHVDRTMSTLALRVGEAVVGSLAANMLVDADGAPLVARQAQLVSAHRGGAPGAEEIPSIRIRYPGSSSLPNPTFWLLSAAELSDARPGDPEQIAETCATSILEVLENTPFLGRQLVFRSGPRLVSYREVTRQIGTSWHWNEDVPRTPAKFTQRIVDVGNKALGLVTGSSRAGQGFGSVHLLPEQYSLVHQSQALMPLTT